MATHPSPTGYIPPAAQKEADWLGEHTGTEAEMSHDGTGVIRISHGHSRLRVETIYRKSSQGWKRSSSQLFQDGEKRPPVGSWGEYAALFAELSEGTDHTDQDSSAALPTLAPIPDGTRLPVEIHQQVSGLKQALADREGVEITTGVDDKRRFVIEVLFAKATMQLVFETERRSGAKRAALAAKDSIRLVTSDGVDHTKEINGRLDAALDRLTQAGPAHSGTAEGPTGSEQGPQAGGPAARKGTVLRL
ncbi:hypothetical protein GCM10010289_70450 [Streptomyces violascens]|nr:hypothetical protein GCM10010289_70450 [Streptomyces violascens]